jgi:hypothetical protein
VRGSSAARLVSGCLIGLACLACGGGSGGGRGPSGSDAAPAITRQPASTTVYAGQTATFSVVATGTPAPTYQWQRYAGSAWTDLAGAAAASYTTAATVTADGGARFRVVVTNRAGTATSDEATLTVNAAVPTTKPTISGLAVAHAEDYSATLGWTTDRACSGAITYQKSGGTARTVQEVGRATSHSFTLDSLDPSSTYSVSVVATDAYGNVSDPATITLTTAAASTTPTVTVTLDPTRTTPISKWIYGINGLAENGNAPPHLTLDRSGGNRLTAYDWENNASNAGSDWYYHSDNLMSASSTPAQAMVDFITADRAIGAASLITLQMQGYVAADEAGNVDISAGDAGLAARLAARFKKVVFKKSTVSAEAFTASPSTGDANVYMDEYAWALDHRLSGQGIFSASAAVPTFVCLDNEPEQWNTTHEEVQGTTPVTPADYIQKTVDLSSAIKEQFPGVLVFGPVVGGFSGLYDFNSKAYSGEDWFTDDYLTQLAAASSKAGKRLLDVFDFHWYSESYGDGTRVVKLDGANLTPAQVQAIVQSPRSLWDPTFTDSTDWISHWMVSGGADMILTRIQQRIDAHYPGTKIAVTEYENGGWNHIAGTIAQADDLGIFGAKGVFAATFWPPDGSYDYALAGFRAFRGFDGASGMFGDVSIAATSSDVSKVAVYASKDSAAAGRLVLVAINRSTGTQKVAIQGQSLSGTASTWRMTAASAATQVAAGQHVAPVLVGTAPVSGTSLFTVLPGLSVSTIVVQ